MLTVDARGLGCPKPVIMAEEAVSKTEEGIVEVLVDNEASVKNLSRFAQKNALYSETEKVDNYWRVKLVKGYPCEVPAPETKEVTTAGGASFFVIGTDTLGKDEELGRILMKGFLETIKALGDRPGAIFFLNAGVKLACDGSESIAVLKELEAEGVKVYSCGTCLKHYGIEDKLRAGEIAGMVALTDGLKDYKKVIWI